MSTQPALALSVDLTDPRCFEGLDEHEFWREVRTERPVYRQPATAEHDAFWVVSRHADVVECYRDTSVYSSARGTVLDLLLAGADSAAGTMLAVTDPPFHRSLRRALAPAFSRRALAAVFVDARRHAEDLVDRWVGAGAFDFATEIAEHLPLTVICNLLDIPAADRGELLHWNKTALSPEDGLVNGSIAVSARNEIIGYFLALADERRGGRGLDVVTTLASTTVDGRALSDLEVATNCYSVLLGGDESSRFTAVCAADVLADNPGQWDLLRSGGVDPDIAAEEILRWATPARHFARTTHKRTVLSGEVLDAGEIVSLWNISANNDETVFDEPRRLRLDRSPNRHVSFGHGPHFCVGAALGRAELGALLSALVGKVGRIELVGPGVPVRSNFLNGNEHLPVRLHPRSDRPHQEGRQ